jgi:hypothetical protein
LDGCNRWESIDLLSNILVYYFQHLIK